MKLIFWIKKPALASAVSLVLLAVVHGNAFASPADWSTSFLLQTTGGPIYPALLVTFNPQPEPPACGFGDWFIFGLDFGVSSLSDERERVRSGWRQSGVRHTSNL